MKTIEHIEKILHPQGRPSSSDVVILVSTSIMVTRFLRKQLENQEISCEIHGLRVFSVWAIIIIALGHGAVMVIALGHVAKKQQTSRL